MFQVGSDRGLLRSPFGEPWADDDRIDDEHNLIAVGVMRPELRTFVRIQPALEQCTEDRRVDF